MKAYRFQVSIHISKVELSVNFPSTLQVMWKRGHNRSLSKPKEKQKSVFHVKETLFMDFVLAPTQSKRSQIVVLLCVQGQSKLAGVANFTISEGMPPQGFVELGLEKSPDQHAKIYFEYFMQNQGETEAHSDSRISEVSNQRTIMGESFGIFDKENQNLSVPLPALTNKKLQDRSQPQQQVAQQSSDKKTVQQLKQELQLNRELYENSLRDYDNLKGQSAQQKEQLKSLAESLEGLRLQVQEKEVKLQQFKNENEYLDQQMNTLQMENKTLVQQQQSVRVLEQQIEKLTKDLEVARNQNMILETKYQMSVKKAKQLEEKLEQTLKSKVESGTNTNYFEIQEIVEKDKELRGTQSRMGELQRTLDKLSYENQNLTNQAKILEQEVRQGRHNGEMMSSQLMQFKMQSQTLEQENLKLKERVSKLEQEMCNREQWSKQSSSEQARVIQNLQQQLESEKAYMGQLKDKYKEAKVKAIRQAEIIEQLNEELNVQSLQFLKELQILARKQESFKAL